MPSSLRTELDRLKFDWEAGQMIMQAGSGYNAPGPIHVVKKTDPLLDQRFSNGAGFLDMPRFLAADPRAVYIPYRDARGSGLRRIFHEPAEYVETGEDLPFPED